LTCLDSAANSTNCFGCANKEVLFIVVVVEEEEEEEEVLEVGNIIFDPIDDDANIDELEEGPPDDIIILVDK
jgi:hypothetical protein